MQRRGVITLHFDAGAGGVLVPPETGLVAVGVADFDEVVAVVRGRRLLEVFEADFVDLVRDDREIDRGGDTGELLAVQGNAYEVLVGLCLPRGPVVRGKFGGC